MENSLKGLMMAAGIVITCVIIGLGFVMLRQAESTANKAGDELSTMQVRIADNEYGQYDGLDLIGADVVNFTKKNLSYVYQGEIPEIKVTINKLNGAYTYIDNTSLSSLQDESSSRFVDPLVVFKGKVVRDSNKVITEVVFNQKR